MSNLNMMLHCGGVSSDLSEVSLVPTPTPTASHFPVSHRLMIDLAQDGFRAAGLEVLQECYGLRHNGQEMFGMFRVGFPGHDDTDHGTIMGIRNSHIKSFAAALALGSHVFVCDNLAISGEIRLARKHTRHILRDLPRVVTTAVGRLTHHRKTEEERITAYKATELTDVETHDLVCRALRSQAIGGGKVSQVLEQWYAPAHEDFEPRTMWSLQNCFTEVWKSYKPDQMNTAKRTHALCGVLDPVAGLLFDTPGEVLDIVAA